MTSKEFVTIMLEKRRKNEIEEYVEEVLEDMSEMELTGPSAESLEGKQLSYGVWPTKLREFSQHNPNRGWEYE